MKVPSFVTTFSLLRMTRAVAAAAMLLVLPATALRIATAPRARQCLMSADEIRAVTDQDFEEVVLTSSAPVLVCFSAEWCGPCKMM